MGRGVSTMEPCALGVCRVAGGSLSLTENKRFLPSMHDDRRLRKNNLHDCLVKKLS